MYFRMLFQLIVALYTSRVVLNALGAEDYGIYNVAGGVIAIFAFINGAMTSASQRYITFTLGRNDKEALSKVFSTSVQIHALIALFILVIGESAGLWFLEQKLVIPEDRMSSALWVFQCSILVSMINILTVPYNADIIANEKMSAFAYISIFEVSLKLLIVYLLQVIEFDKLKLYAIMLLLVQIMIWCIYVFYCHKNFQESKYVHKVDRALLKEMSGFAGWSFFGNFANVLYTQGLNMMLNIFFGPIVNAARGIAIQAQSAVQMFVSNFQTALNPQITKNYAVGNLERMHSLMFMSARFSFSLLLIIVMPLFLETDLILTLWLKTYPENTAIFLRIMLLTSMIYTFVNPCVIANQATGKVKRYQIVVGSILLMILPISYILLLMGAPAYYVFVVHLAMECVAQFGRMYILKDLINLRIKDYFITVYIPSILIALVSLVPPLLINNYMEGGVLRLFVTIIVSAISVCLSFFAIGLRKQEKVVIINYVKSRI